MIDFSASLFGMTQAETSVNQVATQLAKAANDSVDLSADTVSLIAARDNFAIDVSVAQAEDQMSERVLSVVA